MEKICNIPECGRQVWVAQMCSIHYNRIRKYGTPNPKGIRIIGDHKGRFFSKVDKTEGCWNWTAKSGTPQGYPTFTINRVTYMAHRISHEWFVGPIPNEYQVDHLCRNIKCVRPDHLEAVTQAENLRRQHEAAGNLNRGCLISGCEGKHRSNGYCNPHFLRWKRHGDPLGGRPPYRSSKIY